MARQASFIPPEYLQSMGRLPIEALGRQADSMGTVPLPPLPSEVPSAFQMQQQPVQVQKPKYSNINQAIQGELGVTRRPVENSPVDIALSSRFKPTFEDISMAMSNFAVQDALGKAAGPTNVQDIVGQRIEQLKAISGLNSGASGGAPSNVREYQYFSQLTPDEQQRYLEVKRSQQWLNLGGEYRNPISGDVLQKTPAPEQMPAFKGEQTAAQERAKYEQEKMASRPRATSAYQMADEKIKNTLNVIDEVERGINWSTTGFAGELQAIVQGSPAFDLRANIDTLLADSGFRELQEMRDSSPTGGALGQVTERELALLQSRVAAIKASQSEAQLRKNLMRFKEQMQKSLKAAKDAYYQTYGEYPRVISGEMSGETSNQTQTNRIKIDANGNIIK